MMDKLSQTFDALQRTGNRPSVFGDRIVVFPVVVPTNRQWLTVLSTAEFVAWIKNSASKMSDAELLKWLEEKHETD